MLDRQINIKVEVKVQKDNRLHGNYCGGTSDKDDKDKQEEDYDSIEEYSPEQDTWKTLAIKLPQPMSGHFTFVH